MTSPKALRVLATLGLNLGDDLEQAAGRAAASLAIWRELGDAWRVADALRALGQVLVTKADHERAAPVLEEAAARLDGLGEAFFAAVARMWLGMSVLERGDDARAEAILKEVLPQFRHAGRQWALTTTLRSLGQVAMNRSDLTAAADRYAESLALWEEFRTRETLLGALGGVAQIAAAGGNPLPAARLLAATAALGETVGYVAWPAEKVRRRRAEEEIRSILGEAGFEAAWIAGRALSWERAVDEAQAVLAAVGTPAAPAGAAVNVSGLTPRELEVLRLVADGLSDRAVAAALFIGASTVRAHLAKAFGKLEVGSRTAAVAAARRLGIL